LDYRSRWAHWRRSDKRPVRGQLDIDSFDFLTILEHLHEKTGVDVPESDYGKMMTLDGSVDYLVRRLAGA
jgi:acyl carrier protein